MTPRLLADVEKYLHGRKAVPILKPVDIYGKELFELFEQLKRNPSGQADIWSKIQNTMLNFATNGGSSEVIREQVLAGAGDSFTRMENCWSLLLKND